MVHIKHYTFLIVIVCFVTLLSACNNLNTTRNNKDVTKTENHNSINSEKHQKNKKRLIGKK